MTTHTLNGREVMLVEVPEEVNADTLFVTNVHGDWDLVGKKDGNLLWLASLPAKDIEVILDTKEAQVKDYEKVVERWFMGYRNYECREKPGDENYHKWVAAINSFHSFLRSIGLDTSKRYIILQQGKSKV